MKRFGVLLLTLVLVVSLTACGGTKINSNDPSVGKWTAVSVSMLGFSMEINQVFPDGAFVELNANGKGTFTIIRYFFQNSNFYQNLGWFNWRSGLTTDPTFKITDQYFNFIVCVVWG